MISVSDKERYPNGVALLSALFSLGVVLFIFYLIKLITPIPPFPESASSGGMEINYGIYNEGTGRIEENSIGEATDVIVKENVRPQVEPSKENVYTSERGEDVLISDPQKKLEVKNNTTIIHPTETKKVVKEKTIAELLAEKFNKSKGKSGGDGSSENVGNEGEPEGNPFTHGRGGLGSNPGGTQTGSGTGGGKGPFGFDLKGRSLLYHPPLPSDAKEEGIVVVEIKVDKSGKVIEADPNGRGTTTTSSVLKAKARQFALQLRFTPNSQYEEQKGSITIIFSFK